MTKALTLDALLQKQKDYTEYLDWEAREYREQKEAFPRPADFNELVFDDSTKFENLNLTEANFAHTDLRILGKGSKPVFVNCILDDADFSHCNLSNLDFSKAKSMRGCLLDGANYEGANFWSHVGDILFTKKEKAQAKALLQTSDTQTGNLRAEIASLLIDYRKEESFWLRWLIVFWIAALIWTIISSLDFVVWTSPIFWSIKIFLALTLGFAILQYSRSKKLRIFFQHKKAAIHLFQSLRAEVGDRESLVAFLPDLVKTIVPQEPSTSSDESGVLLKVMDIVDRRAEQIWSKK